MVSTRNLCCYPEEKRVSHFSKKCEEFSVSGPRGPAGGHYCGHCPLLPGSPYVHGSHHRATLLLETQDPGGPGHPEDTRWWHLPTSLMTSLYVPLALSPQHRTVEKVQSLKPLGSLGAEQSREPGSTR